MKPAAHQPSLIPSHNSLALIAHFLCQNFLGVRHPDTHPGNDVAKANRSQIMAALKQLNLTPAVDNDWVLRDFE